MSVVDDLRRAALRDVLHQDAANTLLATPDDEGSTVADSRTKPADDFAAGVLGLWGRLHDGSIDTETYDAEVEAAFDRAVGEVPPDAQATIASLRQKALDRAERFRDSADLQDDAEDFPSSKQRSAWANGVAGAAWGAVLAVGAYKLHVENVTWRCLDDASSCDFCVNMDGESWSLDEVEVWPGDGTSDCMGNCRCELS